MSFSGAWSLAIASTCAALGLLAITAAPALAASQDLKVTVTGPGTVTSSPEGINCGSSAETCESPFEEGTTVTLTESHGERAAFDGWQGCEAESGAECTLTIGTAPAAAVKAGFAAIPQQTLAVAAMGSGAVTSTSPGSEFASIDCGYGATTCEAEYDEGATVILFATPAAGYHFAAWGGACASDPGPECTLSVSAATTASADFVPTFQSLSIALTGGGEVTSTPAGIACAASAGSCQADFPEDSIVTLADHPFPHQAFLGWPPGECIEEPGPAECEVQIGPSEATITAAFAFARQSVTVLVRGGGSVSAGEGSISACTQSAGTCSGSYQEASTLTLTATPVAHYHLQAWSGCARKPTATQCEVEVGPAADVGAQFAPNTQAVTFIPNGPGSLTAESGSIRRCSSTGGACSGEYSEGATLTVFATPAPHYAVSWSGCTRPLADRCELEVGAAAEVSAFFTPITDPLAVHATGTGSGSVSCDGSPCAAAYPEGTALALTAAPAAGSTFVGWSGGGCAGAGPCSLTLEADTTITAVFNATPPPSHQEVKPPPPPLCHKGFVKRHGRCVRRPKPHRHHGGHR